MKRTRMMKQEWILKKIILLLLMLGIALESCVLFAQAAETGDYSNEVGVQQLGVSYNWTEDRHGTLISASKEIKAASGQISVNVKSYKLSNSIYTTGNLELIFTNNYESDAYLSFDWTITNGYGSFTIDGDGPNGSKTGSVSKKLASHQSVKVTITSGIKNKYYVSPGAGMNITNIKLVEDVKQVTVTFLEPEIGGSYTVDEESITSTTSKTSPSNHVYELVAKADQGYVFAGWKNEKNEYYSTEKSWRKAFSDNVSVCPVLYRRKVLSSVSVTRSFSI